VTGFVDPPSPGRDRRPTDPPQRGQGAVTPRSPLAVLVVTAAVVVATALSAARFATGAPPPGLLAPRDALQALLDARAEAYLERDREAFMATVASDSPRFRARQRDFFAYSGTIPFASYRLEADWDHYGNLARPAHLRRYPGAEAVVILLVHEKYAIRDFDQRPASEDYLYTFVQRDGDWLIAEDSDLDTVGLRSVRHLWDFGPVVADSSDHFTILRHPCGSPAGCVRLPRDFLAIAEEALAQVDRLWRVPWRHKILILAPTTTAELRRMIQATFELDNFVAFAYSTYETGASFDLAGYRIMLNWEQIAGRDRESLRTIMAHELLHVATRPVTGPFVPTFVEEGLAEHVARARDPDALSYFRSRVSAGAFDRKLPRDFEFITGDGFDIFLSYQEALSAMSFLARRWGEGDLRRFYLRLGRPKFAPGTSTYHVGRALRGTIGLGYVGFERAWASSITG
jgi:hypothetical protein